MATFSWKIAESFVWNEWWDFTGLADSEASDPPVQTATQFRLQNVAEGVLHVFSGNGFSNYNVDGVPASGTVTRVQIYDADGVQMADINGLSIQVGTLTNWVQTLNVNAFINAAFGGADTFNGNALGDEFFGRNGNDTMNGNAGNDSLNGENGDDALNGGKGLDTLNGGANADTLNGGLGRDTLTGGAGADKFVLNVAGAANRDTITDFVHGTDKVQLDNSVFTALGADGVLAPGRFWIAADAHDANDRIVYNSSTGALFYDADGNGVGAKVQIATLDTGLGLTSNDFVVI
ncbi:MAG: calcium-binding protein [Hyphomonadaceae bacterium]|nr:calcium-binding protein [Hyphomonadaceae bacterium]